MTFWRYEDQDRLADPDSASVARALAGLHCALRGLRPAAAAGRASMRNSADSRGGSATHASPLGWRPGTGICSGRCLMTGSRGSRRRRRGRTCCTALHTG
jgi:hypothetical protein